MDFFKFFFSFLSFFWGGGGRGGGKAADFALWTVIGSQPDDTFFAVADQV